MRKYGEFIHNFFIQYVIKKNKYPKTLQEAVCVMRNVKFKPENKNDKSNTQKQNKNVGVEKNKSNETNFAQTHKHENLIRNPIPRNPHNHIKVIRDLVQNVTLSQWPRGLTVPT